MLVPTIPQLEMTEPILSRSALTRVLQSLLMAEFKAARGGAFREEEFPPSLLQPWSEDLNIAGNGSYSLGCDSLELMGLAAATNEMFHPSQANLDTGMLSARTFGEWLDIIQNGWRAGVAEVTFQTSGSTGTPKRRTHPFSHLQTEVDYLARMFMGQRRIVALTPPHHIYGFIFTAMLSDRLGLEVASSKRTGLRGEQLELLSGDLIVAIPEQWQFLDGTVRNWPKDIHGVVSTAPCPRQFIQALIEAGLQGMTEIYGSTETSGIGTRTWPAEKYRLMPHWRPETTSELHECGLIHDSGMSVKLMDRVNFSEDGCFLLAGRLDGSVQVGGTNVYPARIAALLASLPGVADAAVRLMRPEEGTRLKAFVVPDSEFPQDNLRKELEVWIKTHLTTMERPKSITLGPDMPTALPGCGVDW
jgi:long-chain acyl-CoA synthetase